eukprot:714090-Pyramimonas_sp.AAC.1
MTAARYHAPRPHLSPAVAPGDACALRGRPPLSSAPWRLRGSWAPWPLPPGGSEPLVGSFGTAA